MFWYKIVYGQCIVNRVCMVNVLIIECVWSMFW